MDKRAKVIKISDYKIKKLKKDLQTAVKSEYQRVREREFKRIFEKGEEE